MSSTAASRALIREGSDSNQQTSASETADSNMSELSVQESIRKMAYALWEKRGRPEGTAEQDWRDAEQQVHLLREQTTVFRG